MGERYEDIYTKQFSFGKNWQKYVAGLTEERIVLAERSLRSLLGVTTLSGKVFLDIGCGSGLFSLAAVRLGAQLVVSIDVDRSSVAAAKHVRRTMRISQNQWRIEQGSALDTQFLASLPSADVVYSWGVLHHTGEMWHAIENVANIVPPSKLFVIAIYNRHKGFPTSESWLHIKRFYANRGAAIRWCMRALYMVYFTLGMLAHRRNPLTYIRTYGKGSARGMDFYRDVEDWLGGYPYEYASATEMHTFFRKQGFILVRETRTSREGCNEFVFRKGVSRASRVTERTRVR